MLDARFFSGTFGLYRPTVATSVSHSQTIVTPTVPTEAALPCVFVPGPGAISVGPEGIVLSYDAVLLVPVAQVLYPEGGSNQPDHVRVGTQMFVVLSVVDAAGRGFYKRALLREKKE